MNPETTPNPCRHCGTCCEKGGPSLHVEDRPLVDEGHIPARYLFTLRRGEMVRDNVKGTLAPLSAEIIKIKGHIDGWTCLFYERVSRKCGIYDHRPLECRALNCRDTRRIEEVYQSTRLTRQALLSGINGLWELVEDHERHCSYAGLHSLVEAGSHEGRLEQENAILEMVRFDAHVRQLSVEKGGLDRRMLDFIFGRSLADTIKQFEIGLVQSEGRFHLVLEPTFSRKQKAP